MMQVSDRLPKEYINAVEIFLGPEIKFIIGIDYQIWQKF